MATTDDLSDPANWTGGFYELLLILGATDDDRFDRAVRSLWRAAGVRECRVGPMAADIEPSAAAFEVDAHLRGSLVLPCGARVVCGAYSDRDEDVDRLELYLPLGPLAQVDRRIGGYPFDDRSGAESLTWRTALDRWLADIAVDVYSEVSFRKALIGFEIDEQDDVSGNERRTALLQPGPEGLNYCPATV